MTPRTRFVFAMVLGVCVLLGAHALPCLGDRLQVTGYRLQEGKVVVVVANRLVLSDLADPKFPTISRMLNKGSVGLVSPTCAGWKSETAVLLSAGAGAASRGGVFAKEVYDADERTPLGVLAGDEFTARTGAKARSGSAVFLGLGPVARANVEAGTNPAQLGALGEAIRQAGRRTAAVGNADMPPDEIDRSAAVLAMDLRGVIDVGMLAGPGDASGLCKRVKRAAGLADLVVVNYGHTTQLDEAKLSMSDDAYAANKARALRDLDWMLGELIDASETKGATFVLVSFSPPATGAWNQLTPIAVYPAKTPGVLTSPTTRTDGLIAATDFAPTVLDLMRVPAVGGMIGQAARQIPAKDAVARLQGLDVRVVVNEKLIAPILWVFALAGAVCFAGAGILVVLRPKVPAWIPVVLRAGMLGLACPLISMLLAAAAPPGIASYAIATFVSLVVVAVLCAILARIYSHKACVRAFPLVLVFAATVAVVLADGFTGSGLCRFALPSSYQVTGMRFYGIGNEYAGGLIAMVALVCLFLCEGRATAKSKWAALALCVVTLIVLGVGAFGANYGATVAATVTFGLVMTAIWRGAFGARHVAAFLLLGIVLVAVSGLIDLKLSGQAGSHVARATGATEKLGGSYLVGIAARKTLLNLRLTVSRTAVRALLSFVPFLALWFWGVQGKVKRMLGEDRRMIAGLKGLLIGSIVAYLLNDSGMVFANIMIAMTLLILLYSLLEKPESWLASPDMRREATACRE